MEPTHQRTGERPQQPEPVTLRVNSDKLAFSNLSPRHQAKPTSPHSGERSRTNREPTRYAIHATHSESLAARLPRLEPHPAPHQRQRRPLRQPPSCPLWPHQVPRLTRSSLKLMSNHLMCSSAQTSTCVPTSREPSITRLTSHAQTSPSLHVLAQQRF